MSALLLPPVRLPCIRLAEEEVCVQQLPWFLLASKGATAVLLMKASYTAASCLLGEHYRERCCYVPMGMSVEGWEKIPESQSDKS